MIVFHSVMGLPLAAHVLIFARSKCHPFFLLWTKLEDYNIMSPLLCCC